MEETGDGLTLEQARVGLVMATTGVGTVVREQIVDGTLAIDLLEHMEVDRTAEDMVGGMEVSMVLTDGG